MVYHSSVKVHTVTVGQTYGADRKLLSQVKRTIPLRLTASLESSITIVFCPITCRVGSDVESAMNKVPGYQKIILVLMHHTRDEHYSTAGKVWSEELPNVILDVHVLFHETVPGLLECAKNREAVNQIVYKLDQFPRNQQIRYQEEDSPTYGLLGRHNELYLGCVPRWKIFVAFIVLGIFILILVIVLGLSATRK